MLTIENIEDVRITKISHYKVHFKIKDEEYFLKDGYECGEGWCDVFQKRRADGSGRNNTVFLSKMNHCQFNLRIGKFSKPKSHYIKEFVLKLEREGFATTPFKNKVEEDNLKIAEINNEIKVHKDDIIKLSRKILEIVAGKEISCLG